MDRSAIRSNPFVLSLFRTLAVVAVVLSLLGAGCASWHKDKPLAEDEETGPPEVELRTWQEGFSAFQEGDYERAMAIFDILTEMAQSDELYRMSLYGLAVTRLITAQTPEDFRDAVALWKCWSEQPAIPEEEEDPRMLGPFLERLTPPGKPVESPPPKAKKPVNIVPYATYQSCREQVQNRDKEIERLKTRLEAKERESRRLKQQIETLEQIHLKFQEKKQGMESP